MLTEEQIAALQPVYHVRYELPTSVNPMLTNWDDSYDYPKGILSFALPAEGSLHNINTWLQDSSYKCFGVTLDHNWGKAWGAFKLEGYRMVTKTYVFPTRELADAAIATDVAEATAAVNSIIRTKLERLALRAKRIAEWGSTTT